MFALFFLAVLALPHILACSPPSDSSNDVLEIGTDGPADPATLGYALNHFALISSNLTTTKQFYGEVLGMRHILTFHASPTYDIMYMGYSRGGKNGTGYQTGEELYAEKANTEGLLEFLTPRDGAPPQPTMKMPNSFSHVGLIVPDIRAAQDRMQAYNMTILKALGETASPEGPIATAYGLGGNATEAARALEGIQLIGFSNFLLVADPDGNVVEIQQQS